MNWKFWEHKQIIAPQYTADTAESEVNQQSLENESLEINHPIQEPVQQELEMGTQYRVEITFTDNSMVKVNYFSKSGDSTCSSFKDEFGETFYLVIDCNIKSYLYSKENVEKNLIVSGIEKVKPPKYSSNSKRSRLKDVE